jgi:hypothetical protein
MAKATLEYDLTDNDDRLYHMRAVKSLDLALSLWQIVYNTRKGIEHELEFKDMTNYELLDKVYGEMRDILDRYNINIDELIN